ncbi:IS1 family transposase [uncultured Methylobacterium sp.]|uniref:IS1 family transposase n=1 Tax=uncultured Methylobacterium sp. TaxID=157278 RepID=UPI0035CB2DE7
MRGLQRYRCRSCGCNDTEYSDVSVLRRARAEAEALPEPDVPADVRVLSVDAMGHSVKKPDTLWLWRAYDPVGGRTVAWVPGRRDDATCRRLLDRTGTKGITIVTDDRDGYHRLIPAEQRFSGKDLNRPHGTRRLEYFP